MVKLKRYQATAVRELLVKIKKLLALDGDRRKIVFKAPTGSGKTVMAASLMERITAEVSADVTVPFSEVAFVWFAPNKLHEQSYFKLKAFAETNEYINPMRWDDIDHSLNHLTHGDALFLNWESVNKDNSVIMRDNEQSFTLTEIVRRTQEEQHIPVIVIVDEEHQFSGKNAKKAQQVLSWLNPKIELRISATPVTMSDYRVTVERQDVIDEEMIKKGMVLNPQVDDSLNTGLTLNQRLLKKALAKRAELAGKYSAEGVDINPLLLIQLPNDNQSLSADDRKIKDELEAYLSLPNVDITEANGRMAVWLSGHKSETLKGIENFKSTVDVLLFKQAIALGWDCPRAHVLLIFRDIKSPVFAVQTVGRIMRMPEQRFYRDESLNKGFVYTNLSAETIQVVREDMNYLSTFVAVRKAGLCNVSLEAECAKQTIVRNRLGSDFKKVLYETAKGRWRVKNPTEEVEKGRFKNEVIQENCAFVAGFINLDKRRIMAIIPKDMPLKAEEGEYVVSTKARIARTQGEVERLFQYFCLSHTGSFARNDSAPVLEVALIYFMEEFFGIYETDAIKVILHSENRPQFIALIEAALDNYQTINAQKRATREMKVETYIWEVPEERIYAEDTHRLVPAPVHAMQPFFALNAESDPEEKFRDFLEKHNTVVDWWYKNGDKGKEHFSVVYKNLRGEYATFYVDFVIRKKDGTLCLFDTKSQGSDPEAVNKHNALVDYLEKKRAATGGKLIGGVLIGDSEGKLWRYSETYIDNTDNIAGWKVF